MRNSRIFDYAFLACGLLIQVVTYGLSAQFSILNSQFSILSLISGCLGVCSVCLTAQGSILTYVFGFLQVITYTWLCYTQRFYGEMAINGYYFVTMIIGVHTWRQNIKSQMSNAKSQIINPHSLSLPVMLLIGAGTLLLSGLAGWGLASWTDDTQPYLDAFTTVPALVAQILMILVFREHWLLWLAVDVLSIILWFRAGDWCMVAQYAFWCANCFYGLYKWRKVP